LVEVDRVANRNAKPALALSALSLALTRTLRPSQAVIRPDYLTAPRLSAQLSALHGLGKGAQQGIFFRNPAALDRLSGADVYVFDDSAGLERRRVVVANVHTVTGVAEALVGDYVLAAQRHPESEPSQALAVFTASSTVGDRPADSLRHHAGVTRYLDSRGHAIEVATSEYVAGLNIEVPLGFPRALTGLPKESEGGSRIEVRHREDATSLRPLWVLRDGQIIGVVSFARSGEIVGKRAIEALDRQDKRARLIYLSRGKAAAARALAGELGFEEIHGGLDQAAKAELIRGIGRPTVWVGDGTDQDRRESIAASTVSVSVAPLQRSPQDLADILLPYEGLDALSTVVGISQAHAARLARDYRTVYAANLAGVGGAFLARFNALRAGLLSNFGTGLVYARQARALNRLAGAGARSRG
jgi:cation transport ATPase